MRDGDRSRDSSNSSLPLRSMRMRPSTGGSADRLAAQSCGPERRDDLIFFRWIDLQHRAELLVEQRLERRSRAAHRARRPSRSAWQTPFRESGKQAAIRAVVIGKQPVCRVKRLNDAEERFQLPRVVEVRRDVAHLTEHLGERRASETILAVAEVNQ